MRVIRPVGDWVQGVEHLGLILVEREGQEPRPVLYGILEGGVATLLEPGTESGGWRLAPVRGREQMLIASRHPEVRLQFPDRPVEVAWRERRGPLQAVDPQRINLVYNGDQLRALLRSRGQTRPGDWDRDVLAEPLGETAFYRALHAHFETGRPWGEIEGVDAVISSPTLRRGASGRQDSAEAQASIDDLYRTIEAEGYKLRDEEGSGSRRSEVQAAIGRDGRYLLLDGARRIAIARLLGLDRVPVNVAARHSEWESFREEIVRSTARARGKVYQRIEHPDLFDLPAHHGDDRLPLIEAALEGYDPQGKRLVDVGAHWGQMSYAMELLGFDVTAVEIDEESAEMTRRLRDASEARFSVWTGSIFEFPEIGDQDVVLGLNIFHHFLKTKETYEGLVSMLERLKAEMVIFAAHRYDRGQARDMREAHKDYSPEEFARFVSVHSRLPGIELLGKSHDGRSLFKIFK